MSSVNGDNPRTIVERRFIGVSRVAGAVRSSLLNVAQLDRPVLIRGECGVGKSLAATIIHKISSRAGGPFVRVRNRSSGMPGKLPHGSLSRTALPRANNGTIFVDEVGRLDKDDRNTVLQVVKLDTDPLSGPSTDVVPHVRVIAGTHDDLSAGRHSTREFCAKLHAVEVQIPPLRDRLEDIESLALHFLRRASRRMSRPVRYLSDEAVDVLRSYHWPGNVAEFSSVIERGVALCKEKTVGTMDLVVGFTGQPLPLPKSGCDWKKAKENFERVYALSLLKQHRGSVPRAASAANVDTRSFYKILRRLNIPFGASAHGRSEAR